MSELFPELIGLPDGVALCVGIDRVEIAEFHRTLDVAGDRFLRRVYTPREIEESDGRVDRLAGRFAAKEAMSKALGTGIRGISWTDMEIKRDPSGRPSIQLFGRAKARADELGFFSIAVSLTHTSAMAEALVAALQRTTFDAERRCVA